MSTTKVTADELLVQLAQTVVEYINNRQDMFGSRGQLTNVEYIAYQSNLGKSWAEVYPNLEALIKDYAQVSYERLPQDQQRILERQIFSCDTGECVLESSKEDIINDIFGEFVEILIDIAKSDKVMQLS